MSAVRPLRRSLVDEVDLDGEVVAFDGTSVHHLAGPAAAVWRLCDGALTSSQMALVLSHGYGVPEAEARAAVLDVIDRLRSLGLVT